MPRASIRPRACGSRDRPALVAALALVVGLAGGAHAADWPRDSYDPAPRDDDVILPMPCGGAMAFRKVVIPSEGPLADRRVRLGGTGGDRGYLEGARPAHVAGSFSDGPERRYYLLGKYEVNRLQYAALGEPCPTPGPDGRLPQTEVGWMDALLFADRYTLWLRAHAPEALPAEDKEPGFVRLPTEVEWEFAARGGIAVSESEFQDRIFPTPDGPAKYVWFAGDRSANGKAQPIGLKQPNPLGIHDVIGNVDEMVFDPFQLNKLDRLHGQPGGFIVRGGNYLTEEADLRTADRKEVPYYRKAAHRRSKTTGFRLAVGAPVLTSRARLQAVEAAWEELGTEAVPPGETAPTPAEPAGPGLDAEPLADPIDELGVIAEAATDPNMQRRLENLQLAFRASFQARNEARDRAAKARLRLGTFLCQKLKDDGIPIDARKAVYAECVQNRGADHERCRRWKEEVEADETVQWGNLRYYADTIVSLIEDYDESVLSTQLSVLKSEFGARGQDHLPPVADQYAKHAAQYRRQGTLPRSSWLADCKGL